MFKLVLQLFIINVNLFFMGKANLKTWNGVIGKVGNTVTYIRKGVVITRIVGEITKKATKSQTNNRKKIAFTNKFNSPINEFIQFGLKAEAEKLKKIPNDLMLSYTRKSIEGEYPKHKINFTKVIFSKGTIKEAPGLKVELIDIGLEFSWDTTASSKDRQRRDDWLMVMAYFPKQFDAQYLTHATRRSEGKYQFKISKNDKPTVMEIFVSFMSANQKNVSNSVYLGQLILPAYED